MMELRNSTREQLCKASQDRSSVFHAVQAFTEQHHSFETDGKKLPYSSSKSSKIYNIMNRQRHHTVAIPSTPKTSPKKFHAQILQKRGYPWIPVKPDVSRPPTADQMQNYDTELLTAVRNDDLDVLIALSDSGKLMGACNKFSESVLHMACRRASLDVVRFLVEHGADLERVDDYGRTPLHDACWRAQTDFELIEFILDRNSELLRVADVRGSTPLDYVREEKWQEWCNFLHAHMDKYWAFRTGPIDTAKSTETAMELDTGTERARELKFEAGSKEARKELEIVSSSPTTEATASVSPGSTCNTSMNLCAEDS